MNSQSHKAQPVTISLTEDLRARLDRETVTRSLESGRPLTRSAVARELLDRALSIQRQSRAAA